MNFDLKAHADRWPCKDFHNSGNCTCCFGKVLESFHQDLDMHFDGSYTWIRCGDAASMSSIETICRPSSSCRIEPTKEHLAQIPFWHDVYFYAMCREHEFEFSVVDPPIRFWHNKERSAMIFLLFFLMIHPSPMVPYLHG